MFTFTFSGRLKREVIQPETNLEISTSTVRICEDKESPCKYIYGYEECISHNEKGTKNGENCMDWTGKECIPGKDDGSKECDRIRKESGSEPRVAKGGVFLAILVSLFL